MTQKIIILGTGGTSIDILDTINDINARCQKKLYECVGFLDDEQEKWEKTFLDIKVLGPTKSAEDYSNCFFVSGIGAQSNYWLKEKIILSTKIPLDKFTTIVHPSASVSQSVKLGTGTVIFQNVTITSNVKIGNHVVILPNSVVSHNDVVGDYTCIAGGVCISGGVNVGHSCYLGTNSSIMENISIDDYCLIGMGSVVTKSVKSNSVVVGNPAKFLRKAVKEEIWSLN